MKLIKLYAPESYNEIERSSHCDGCGSGVLERLIPDNILGCNILEACCIHDYMYTVGFSIKDKEEADRVFLNNMTRLVYAYSANKITLNIRLWFVKRYYDAVKYYGGEAFWQGKNNDYELKEVYR